MVAHLAREWWLVALRGVISIMFGIAAFVWPGITLFVLIVFFGAYMLVDGVFALVQAVRFRHEGETWPMLLLEGILGLVLAWVWLIGAYAIAFGILLFAAAVRLRKAGSGWAPTRLQAGGV